MHHDTECIGKVANKEILLCHLARFLFLYWNSIKFLTKNSSCKIVGTFLPPLRKVTKVALPYLVAKISGGKIVGTVLPPVRGGPRWQ